MDQPNNQPPENEVPVSTPETQPPVAQSPAPSPAPAQTVQPVNTEPVAQPSVFAANPVVGQPVAPAKKKWLVPAVVGGLLLLAAGGAAAYYFNVYQNPDNVLYDAYKHLGTADYLQVKGVANIDMESSSGVKFKSVEYASNMDNKAPAGQLDLKVNMVIMSSDVSVGGKGMFADNGDLYFQLNGLSDAFRSVIKATSPSARVPDSFYTALGKLQDQWVKVTVDDMKKNDEEAAKTYQCVIDTIKKHKNDSDQPYLDAYKKNAFITKKEDLGVKDGKIGYKLNYDETKAKAYGEAIKDVPVMKEIKDCNKNKASDSTSNSTVDKPNMDNTSFTAWIDQWSHQLKTVEYTASTTNNGSKFSVNGNVNVAYDTKVKVTAPSGTISLDEFKTRYDDVAAEMNMPSSSSLESSVSSSSLSNEL